MEFNENPLSKPHLVRKSHSFCASVFSAVMLMGHRLCFQARTAACEEELLPQVKVSVLWPN